MLVLDTTTKKVQVALASAVAATQPDFFASWRDITTTVYTPGSNDGVTNNSTDVDVIGAPGASTQRVVDFISLFNKDTAFATPTIKLDVSGVERTLWKGRLNPGEMVTYTDGVGWTKYNALGAEVHDTGVVTMFGGSVTLSVSSTTTVISDTRVIGGSTRVQLTPKTANAAGASLVLYASSIVNGSITLTHNSSALADRTFDYEIFVH